VTSSPDVTAMFCATLVDEWIRSGVTMASIAPGSRSTPMALALAARTEVRIELFHDERSAAFAALGAGLATGIPAVLLCTSGTAAAHFSAAIIEADLSGVPMIVVTADRPPELVDVGAAQTIDQTKMYGDAVRWFHAPGVPNDVSVSTWRSLGARAAAEALGFSGRPGVAHLNVAFREPLVGVAGPLPVGRAHNAPWHSVVRAHTSSHSPLTAALLEAWQGRNGVLIAGRGCGDPTVVLGLGELLGWPVFADHRSGCAVPQRSIRHFDAVLRHEKFVAAHRPDVIVRIGELPASKVTGQWIAATGAIVHAVVPVGKWIDPDHLAGALIVDSSVLVDMCTVLRDHPRPARRFSDAWEHADSLAASAITSGLNALQSLTDPAIARAAVRAVPSNGALVVSSSMPVRDVEWFGEARNDISVFSNRGANGIDGVIATAIGVACATGKPTVCLIGDVAFLHDSSSLSALIKRKIELTIVVPNNDGGAIFSFLPQATAMDNDRYEQLFGTPHGTDLVALSKAHGLFAESITSASQITFAPGIRVLVAETQRTPNVAVHHELNALVCAALDTLVS
jgi:2-succinyl-5-enolpyruvyl-6-hydroxy-3-cyclohexene-1-carboxylate synthase